MTVLQKAWTLLALITAVGTVFRLYLLGEKSIWIDEAVSVALAQSTWTNFWGEVSSYEGNMAFYYLLLRGWIRLGQSEFVIRSLSALLGLAALPSIYFLGKRLFNRETGLISAALLAVHAAHIQLSQEARSYSLLSLLLILSTYLFVCAVETPQRKTVWFAYIFLSALAVYCHVLAVLILGAQWLSIGFIRLRKIGIRTTFWTLGSMAVLVGPMAAFLLLNDKGQLDWIQRPTVLLIAHALGFLTGGGVILLFLAYISACIFAIASLVQTKRTGCSHATENFHVRMLVLCVIFPIAVMLSFSFLYRPLFSYRYLGISVPAMVLLAGRGLSALKQRWPSRRWAMPAALTVFCGLSLVGTYRYYRGFDGAGNDWRSVSRYILERYQNDDAIFFYIPAGYRSFAYYANRESALRADGFRSSVVFPVAGSSTNYDNHVTAQQIDYLTRNYRRVWLVLHQEDVGRQHETFRSLLPKQFICVEEREFAGNWPHSITVALYLRLPQNSEENHLSKLIHTMK